MATKMGAISFSVMSQSLIAIEQTFFKLKREKLT